MKAVCAVAAIVLLGALVFANSLRNGFVDDDPVLIVQNHYVSAPGYGLRFFTDPVGTQGDHICRKWYRPVRVALNALEYRLWGAAPAGYHLTSVALHTANAVLVFALLAGVLRGKWPAVWAAAMFLVHPAQAEAVNYISAREDLLAAFFSLAALLLFVQGRGPGSVLCFVAALGAKETAVVMPALLAAYVFVFGEPQKGRKTGWVWAAFFLAAVVYFLVRRWTLGAFLPLDTVPGFAEWEALAAWGRTAVRFLQMYVLGPDSGLVVDVSDISAGRIALAAGVLAAGALGAAAAGPRGRRAFGFAVCWYAVALLPVAALVLMKGFVCERNAYLPSVGLFWGAAAVVSGVRPPLLRRAVAAIAALTAVAAACATVGLNAQWKDGRKLWEKTARALSGNPQALCGWGFALLGQGQAREALEQFLAARALAPGLDIAALGTGEAWLKLGDRSKARAEFLRACDLNPLLYQPRFGLAEIEAGQGRFAAAAMQYGKVLEAAPGHIPSRMRLAELYERCGAREAAAEQYRAVLNVAPLLGRARERLERAGETR